MPEPVFLLAQEEEGGGGGGGLARDRLQWRALLFIEIGAAIFHTRDRDRSRSTRPRPWL